MSVKYCPERSTEISINLLSLKVVEVQTPLLKQKGFQVPILRQQGEPKLNLSYTSTGENMTFLLLLVKVEMRNMCKMNNINIMTSHF